MTKPTKKQIEAILKKAGKKLEYNDFECPDVEKAIDLSFEQGFKAGERSTDAFKNGQIVGFEQGLTDELVEKRVKKAYEEGREAEKKERLFLHSQLGKVRRESKAEIAQLKKELELKKKAGAGSRAC